MSVYRLNPIKLNDPSWNMSSEKETLFVGAHNDSEARDIATLKTKVATTPTAKFAPKLRPPWMDDKITSCVLETSKRDVAHGEVITASGRKLSP